MHYLFFDCSQVFSTLGQHQEKIMEKVFKRVDKLWEKWRKMHLLYRIFISLWKLYTRMLHAVLNKSWKQHPRKQPLTSCLTNHQSMTSKICRAMLKKKKGKKWHFPMESYSCIHWCWLTSKNLHSSALFEYWMPSRELA